MVKVIAWKEGELGDEAMSMHALVVKQCLFYCLWFPPCVEMLYH